MKNGREDVHLRSSILWGHRPNCNTIAIACDEEGYAAIVGIVGGMTLSLSAMVGCQYNKVFRVFTMLDDGIEKPADALIHFYNSLRIFIGVAIEAIAVASSVAFVHVYKDETIVATFDPQLSLHRGLFVTVGQVFGIQCGGILMIDKVIYEWMPSDSSGHLDVTEGILCRLEDRRLGNFSHVSLPVRVHQMVGWFMASKQ